MILSRKYKKIEGYLQTILIACVICRDTTVVAQSSYIDDPCAGLGYYKLTQTVRR